MIYVLTYSKDSTTATVLRNHQVEFTLLVHYSWQRQPFWNVNVVIAPELFIVDVLGSVNSEMKGNCTLGWYMIDLVEDLAGRYPESKFIFVQNRVVGYEYRVDVFVSQLNNVKQFRDKPHRMVFITMDKFQAGLRQ